MATKTVKFYKKLHNQVEKPKFRHEDLQLVRRWLITGSFGNTFFLNESFDKSRIGLARKFINYSPDKIEQLMEEAAQLSLNKSPVIYTLVMLSSGPFRAKHIFKSLFDSVITTPKDLYRFMEMCKKERGFGQIIHDSIKQWFRHHDIHELETMFITHQSAYNWKAQDIMRMIKPKPIDKKEQLLFRWLAKNTINPAEVSDYSNTFSKIIAYEMLKTGEVEDTDVCEYINNLGFKNNMIPGNIERTSKVIHNLLTNVESPSLSFKQVPRYFPKLKTRRASETLSFFMLNAKKIQLSIVALLTVYSRMKDVAANNVEVEMLEFSEQLLMDKIRKTYNNYIHIVDTTTSMFDEKLNSVNTSPAVTASIMIGVSKNVFDLDGKCIKKKEPRSIIEAEGFVRDKKVPRYNAIFESIKDIDSNIVFVWTNNKGFRKQEFYNKFNQWKAANQKVMKLVFINLTDEKVNVNNNYKEVYGINEKTERLLKYIKDGII